MGSSYLVCVCLFLQLAIAILVDQFHLNATPEPVSVSVWMVSAADDATDAFVDTPEMYRIASLVASVLRTGTQSSPSLKVKNKLVATCMHYMQDLAF